MVCTNLQPLIIVLKMGCAITNPFLVQLIKKEVKSKPYVVLVIRYMWYAFELKSLYELKYPQ